MAPADRNKKRSQTPTPSRTHIGLYLVDSELATSIRTGKSANSSGTRGGHPVSQAAQPADARHPSSPNSQCDSQPARPAAGPVLPVHVPHMAKDVGEQAPSVLRHLPANTSGRHFLFRAMHGSADRLAAARCKLRG